jgi:hypothetical protein
VLIDRDLTDDLALICNDRWMIPFDASSFATENRFGNQRRCCLRLRHDSSNQQSMQPLDYNVVTLVEDFTPELQLVGCVVGAPEA